MVRQSTIPTAVSEEYGSITVPRSRREVMHVRRTLEELGDARCPLCRVRLVARLGRSGPYFSCRCPRQEMKRVA